jgi:hypothetical protein
VSVPVSRSKPVLILGSVAAGATALVGVLAAVDGVPAWVTATVAGISAVATAVGAVWTTGQVTPWPDVAAKRGQDGGLVAGPATHIATGAAVEVTPSVPGHYVP